MATILQAASGLALRTPSGLWRWLRGVGIHYKRARAHVHSPDPAYTDKLANVHVLLQLGQPCEQTPRRIVVLFEDELTYYRQPSLAKAWHPAGSSQPLAELGYKRNRCWRVAAALDPWTGQTFHRQAEHLGAVELVEFYEQLVDTYPQAERIYVVQDNWPIHFYPDVRAALAEQPYHWLPQLSRLWPEAPTPKARHLNLPIYLAPLPTYASWTNPIEKLWRLLRQELLHLHGFQDDFKGLKAAVEGALSQLGLRSQELLRYTGLSDPLRLYHAVLNTAARAPT